jgi:hypothetical protein
MMPVLQSKKEEREERKLLCSEDWCVGGLKCALSHTVLQLVLLYEESNRWVARGIGRNPA